MSKISALELRCPACDHPFEGEVFSSFNAERLPHLLDAILHGLFEQATCPVCKARFQPEHDMLFSWLPQRLWIVMIPPEHLPDFARLEGEIARTFEEVFATTPEEFKPLLDAVQPRLVFGQHQLAEAVRAQREGIHPALLECAKLAVLRDNLEELLPRGPSYLTFEGLAMPGTLLNLSAWSFVDGAKIASFQLDRALLHDLHRQEEALREAYPALFERPFVSALRYLVPELL